MPGGKPWALSAALCITMDGGIADMWLKSLSPMAPCLVLAGCLVVAGCGARKPVASGAAAVPDDYSNWTRIQANNRERRTGCTELPVVVELSRASISLVGNCGFVRVAGEHLTVTVELASGGTIEATGAHNDIYWKQAAGSRPPTLINAGSSNTFHADR